MRTTSTYVQIDPRQISTKRASANINRTSNNFLRSRMHLFAKTQNITNDVYGEHINRTIEPVMTGLTISGPNLLHYADPMCNVAHATTG